MQRPAAEEDRLRYDFAFVDQEVFEKHATESLAALGVRFIEYRGLS